MAGRQDDGTISGVPVMLNRAGVARELGLTRTRVSQLDMPAPSAWIIGGSGEPVPVWTRECVQVWDRMRERAKPGPKGPRTAPRA